MTSFQTAFGISEKALGILVPEAGGKIPEDWFNPVHGGLCRLNVIPTAQEMFLIRNLTESISKSGIELGVILTMDDAVLLAADWGSVNPRMMIIEPFDDVSELQGLCFMLANPE